MPKKALVPLFTFLFAVSLAMLSAQEGQKNEQEQKAPGQAAGKKAAKQDRWEGVILRSNPDNSILTVRQVGSTRAKTVQYDSSTKWVSQEHGSKKVNDIEANQVKDGDRVIVKGSTDKDGVLHATLISKRLSHSPR
jgi:hypothetical protein